MKVTITSLSVERLKEVSKLNIPGETIDLGKKYKTIDVELYGLKRIEQFGNHYKLTFRWETMEEINQASIMVGILDFDNIILGDII